MRPPPPQPNRTGTDHDHAARASRQVDDRPGIRKRTQRMDIRLVGARDWQAHRLGTRRQQCPPSTKRLIPALRSSKITLQSESHTARFYTARMKLDADRGSDLEAD